MGGDEQLQRRDLEAPAAKTGRIGTYIAAAGGVVAAVVLIAGGNARGTAGAVLFGVVLAGLAAVIGGAGIATVAGRRPAASPEEARQRRSTAMIVFGALGLAMAAAALINGAPLGLLLALLGVGLLVGGLVIRR